MEEVAGNLQVKIVQGEVAANDWLQEYPETEIMDIKLSHNGVILIVYRKEG